MSPFPPAFRPKSPGDSGAPLPPGPTSAIAAELLRVLRAGLGGWTVVGWADAALDATPPADSGPPWLRVSCSPGASRIFCRGRSGVVHRCPVVVGLESSVAGSLAQHSQSAWDAILAALFPVPASLHALGVSTVAIDRPCWAPPTPTAEGLPARIAAAGQLTLTAHYLTPE